ncbi:MAG: hypothetical protein WAU15_10890 [Nitrosomonas sp.]
MTISVLKRVFLIGLMFLFLCGCINKPKPVKHAYRITDISQEIIITIANDAVTQMSVLFAPAKTTISFTHPTTDQFGMAFINGLRKQGFSIKEHAPAQTLDQVLADHQAQQKRSNASENESTVDKNGLIKLEEPDSAVPLSYLLDHTRDHHSITLTAGNLTSVRSYAMEGGQIRPLGHWTRQKP